MLEPQPLWQAIHTFLNDGCWGQPPCPKHIVFDVGFCHSLGVFVLFTQLLVIMLRWRPCMLLCNFKQIGGPMEEARLFTTLQRNRLVTITITPLHNNQISLSTIYHEIFEKDIGCTVTFKLSQKAIWAWEPSICISQHVIVRILQCLLSQTWHAIVVRPLNGQTWSNKFPCCLRFACVSQHRFHF
jgi:hypothetical protein